MNRFSDSTGYPYENYDSTSSLFTPDSGRPDSDDAIGHAIRNEEEYTAQTVRHFSFGSGASLLLVVLIMISIVCFAALSIASAQADERLSDRYQEETDAWQNASNHGQRFIAGIDAELRGLYQETRTEGEEAYYSEAASLDHAVSSADQSLSYYEELQEVLLHTSSEDAGKSPDSAETVFVLDTPLSDTQNYFLVIEPLWPDENDGSCYRVLCAKVRTTAAYDYDSTLNVLH